jgi:hypothetical protein
VVVVDDRTTGVGALLVVDEQVDPVVGDLLGLRVPRRDREDSALVANMPHNLKTVTGLIANGFGATSGVVGSGQRCATYVFVEVRCATIWIWLDWATIRFRFYQPNSGYTGSFCVFGPALSSPVHALISLDMR